MLIGLVVSSKVNCGPGLGVIREPGAERKTVLPGGGRSPISIALLQTSVKY